MTDINDRTGGQVATLPECEHVSNGRNYGHDKETTRTEVLVSWDAKGRKEKRERYAANGWSGDVSDGLDSVVVARWYMGRARSASVVHCSVWITARDGRSFAGHGSAGGYGYHKESAAFDEAVRSAGVSLKQSAHGAGDYAITSAMHAIAVACGYGRCPRTIV